MTVEIDREILAKIDRILLDKSDQPRLLDIQILFSLKRLEDWQ